MASFPRFAALLALSSLLPAAGFAAVEGHASGGVQRGEAAVFAARLEGARMADGGRFETNSDSVASPVLPLGTTARVRNLRNGRSTMVRVRDHLPASGGRILSVSPKVAAELGMGANGLARVEVAPLAVPQRDGSVRLGAGTRLAGRRAHVVESPR